MNKILALIILCVSHNVCAYDAFECKKGKLFYSEDGYNFTIIDNDTKSLDCILKKDNFSKDELETDLRSMHSNLDEIENRFYLKIDGEIAKISDFQKILKRALDHE